MLSNPYTDQGATSTMATVLLVLPVGSVSPLCGYIAKTSTEALMNDYGYSAASSAPSGPHCRFLASDGSLLATAYGGVPVGGEATQTPLSGTCNADSTSADDGWDATIGDAAIGKSADSQVASLASRF